MKEPSHIVAGNTYTWTREWSDFPASEWTLEYQYVNDTNAETVAGVANGDAFDVIISSVESSTWNAGAYRWVALVTKGTERRTAAGGDSQVLPDPAAGPADMRTQLERIRDDLLAGYEALTKKGATEVSVSLGERTVTYRTRAEIWTEIQRINAEIRQEKVASGLNVPGPVRVRFS